MEELEIYCYNALSLHMKQQIIWRWIKIISKCLLYFWPSNPISGNISWETWNTNTKGHTHPYVHSSVIYNSQDLKQSRWLDKKAVVHLHDRILWGHKKEGNLTFCDSMDGPGEYYAKWNKPVRERQVPYDFTYMWNLMNKIN